MDTIFKKHYPVSFRILNEKHEEKIYLESGPASGLLELTNHGGNNIYFIQSGPASLHVSDNTNLIAGPDNFHFALKFRPGILKPTAKSLIKSKLIKKGWALSIGLVPLKKEEMDKATASVKDSGEWTAVLYFLNINNSVFGINESIILPLKHLHLQCDEGTQVTKTELICNNLATDEDFKELVNPHKRHYDLTIVNHRGNPHMPLHIGFTGINAILNNNSDNELSLRITNLQKKTKDDNGIFTFSHRKHSKMYLYFDTGKESSAYALGTSAKLSKAHLEFILPGKQKFYHKPFFQGGSPAWEIFPGDGDVNLQPHQTNGHDDLHPDFPDESSLDILLSGIMTDFKMGVSHLYLRFENIPGFWDHTYAIPVVKQPMIFRNECVCIGTDSPTAKFQVAGGNIKGDGEIISAGEKNAFRVVQGDYEGGLKNDGKDMHLFLTNVKDKNGGWNDLRPLRVNNSTGFVEISNGAIHAKSGGNVGIGTTSPLAPLSIGDSSVPGSDGHIVIGKKKGEATRHFRIGFDDAFNFIIGDYGYSNQAMPWKSPFSIYWQAPDHCLHINGEGNVEIGKDSINRNLDVQGKVTAKDYALTGKEANGPVPKGGIIMWSGSDIPDGWQLCDGTNKTPNLIDKFIMGAGKLSDVGSFGGSATVQLKEEHLPAHSHTGVTDEPGNHTHTTAGIPNSSVGYGAVYNSQSETYKWGANATVASSLNGNHKHILIIDKTGKDTPHENMPPYYTLAFIMKM